MLSLVAWLILRALAVEGWLEVTPLASQDEAVTVAFEAPSGPVKVSGVKAGLALVCIGGEHVAVSCAQQYLEPGAAVQPVVQRGVRVSATVRTGRRAVAGARVELVAKELRSRRFVTLPLARDKRTGRLLRELATDASGRMTTPQLAPGEYLLQVRPPGGRILHRELSVPRPEALLPKSAPAGTVAVLDLGEIVLEPGVGVAVFVTGPGGEPIAGAPVGALQGDSSSGHQFFETATDSAGKAELSGLAPSSPVGISCQAPGFLRLEQRFEAPPPSVGCPLQPLAEIAGSVVDEEDRPVARATVSSKAIDRPATTGKDGGFRMVELPAGTYALTAAARGFAPERVSFTVAPGERRELPPIELSPGRTIRGQVQEDRGGEPIEGARVFAVDPPGAVDEVSGEEGDVTFSLGEEPLQLRVAADGYPETDVEVDPEELAAGVLEGEEPLPIRLQRGGRLHIEVWDEQADLPCAGCAVMLDAVGTVRTARVVTDGRGACLTEPLAPGPYSLAPVDERSLGGIIEVNGGGVRINVEVIADAVTPVVIGERTRVVEVRFHPPAPEGWNVTAASASRSLAAKRLADGAFAVRRRPGEAVTLSLHGDTTVTVHQAVLSADDDRPQIELPLPGGGIRGTLMAGEPAGSARVLSLVTADGTVKATALVTEGSRFAFPFLSPGTYTLMVDRRPVRFVAVATDREEDLGDVTPAPPGE